MNGAGRGWRVVLVRLPPGGASTVQDANGPIPAVLRDSLGWEDARALLDKLHAVGALGALLPDAAVCAVHPTEVAAITCTSCGAWTCAECRAGAGGASLCPACARKSDKGRRSRRLRILFSLFLFSVFLFQVASYLRSEAAALVPPVRVAIVQFAPERLLGSGRLRALNQPDDGGGRSLYDIAAFFEQEHARYTGSGGPILDVTIRGPFAQEVQPPSLGERDAPWWRFALVAWQYPRYFHDLARGFNIEPDNFGARIYVVWTDNAGDVAGDSRGSQKGRVGISWLSVDEPNLGYSVVSVAHELAHILGAIDNYAEGSYLAHWPEGYVEPFAEPLWPQAWAELMAVDRPTGPEDEREVQSLFETRIGYDTAARIGWIAPEQAELYYQPRLTMPEEVLHKLERQRDAQREVARQTLGSPAENMKPGEAPAGIARPRDEVPPDPPEMFSMFEDGGKEGAQAEGAADAPCCSGGLAPPTQVPSGP